MIKKYFYNIATSKPKGLISIIVLWLLTMFSFFYYLVITLRSFLYRLGVFKSAGLNSPVISIGNITWGGTGKTPLAETVCSYFNSRGKRIALLTRGYGRDEEKMLAENIPGVSIVAGKDRLKNARLQLEKGPVDIFILDDGFGHYKIKRDIDIVTINATDPFGQGLLIPAGILREPLSGLSRADLAVITKSDLVSKDALNYIKEKLLGLKPGIGIFDSVHSPVSFCTMAGDEKPLVYVKGKSIAAVSGLGDNRSFAMTLSKLGCNIALNFSYMDHHGYKRGEIDKILKRCRENNIYTVITTQKDSIKIKGLLAPPILKDIEFLILKIKLKVSDEENFFRRLSSILSG